MLTTAADRLPAALAELDPGNRALLDLSLRRGISSAEIGGLLRKDPADVERGVDDVLELLSDALGIDGPDRRSQIRDALEDLPGDAWQAKPAVPPRKPPAVPRPEPERGDDIPYYTPKERRPRLGPAVLFALIVSALVVGTILLFTSGGDSKDEEPSSSDARQSQPNESPRVPAEDGAERASARLQRVRNTSDGTGRVTLSGDRQRLDVRISGLPRPNGAYEIWVYNSIVDAKSLGSFRDTKIKLDARLPDDLENYRFIDVSLEPPDGNPNHSGDSVLRAPVDQLLIG